VIGILIAQHGGVYITITGSRTLPELTALQERVRYGAGWKWNQPDKLISYPQPSFLGSIYLNGHHIRPFVTFLCDSSMT